MKICPKCNAQNKNSAAFCEQCGESLADVAETAPDIAGTAADLFGKAKKAAQAGAEKAQKAASEGAAKAKEHRQEAAAQRAEAKAMKDAGKFIDQSETQRSALGNNYLQNILLGGGAKRGAAILTEKRLYYYGKSFSGTDSHGLLNKLIALLVGSSATEESVVSIEDITQTVFTHTRSSGKLLTSILLLLLGIVGLVMFPPIGVVCLVAALVFLIQYFIQRFTVFTIAFPGGKYEFDVRWYPIADMRDFQRQLYLLKDHIKGNA